MYGFQSLALPLVVLTMYLRVSRLDHVHCPLNARYFMCNYNFSKYMESQHLLKRQRVFKEDFFMN